MNPSKATNTYTTKVKPCKETSKRTKSSTNEKQAASLTKSTADSATTKPIISPNVAGKLSYLRVLCYACQSKSKMNQKLYLFTFVLFYV